MINSDAVKVDVKDGPSLKPNSPLNSDYESFHPPSIAENEATPDAFPSPDPIAQNSISDAPVRDSIADHMLGDQPAGCAKEDKLGFAPYVAAVAKFLTDSSTKIPVTLSIEGQWGSGKSSFMLQLQESLKNLGGRRIVTFNAWQYDADEGLWAAFIHEFDIEMHKNLGFADRIRVRLRLLKLRISWQDAIDTSKTAIWLGASAVASIAICWYLLRHGIGAFATAVGKNGNAAEAEAKTIALVGGVGGTVAAVMLFLNQLKDLFKSPASVERSSRFFARQNYDAKLPLIHHATQEFNSLVLAYAGQEPVYIFIDDLDRCEYSRAAELMQALLMLLSSSPNVALIIGLDRDKVAAAMATKQEKLLPYLYGVQAADVYRLGMEYGQRFLEKFIQVSYILPAPSMSGLKAMINPDVTLEPTFVPEGQKSIKAIEIVTGKDDSQTLNRIIEMADQIFDHNPRNVKQFVNMFRLQAFVANETGLFGSLRVTTDTGVPLTIPQLAKFVALCMRWPRFVEAATFDRGLVSNFEKWLEANKRTTFPGQSKDETPDEIRAWKQDGGLQRLLSFGLPDPEFSIAGIDFQVLTEITPARASSNFERRDPFPTGGQSSQYDET